MDGLTKTVAFRVEPGQWVNFERVAAANGVETAELLRELVAHSDSIFRAIKTGQIASLDGDVASWLTKEFPQLPPGQLRLFAAVLASAADRMQAGSGVRG
ncbi:unnamed protein product [marine sediment metagenome]|uniref:Ribbon-helix-helix domain-containing protein n=2 Tax=marine sediment metagenome TaxID=412755 RepID=X1RPE6_9ZZZZ